MNAAAFQAVLAPPPLAERPPLDPSFDHQFAEQMKEVQTVDATAGDPGRLASPGALVGEVMEGLRGFLQRADAMSKTGWSNSGGQHKGGDALSVDHLHAGPAEASLEPVSFSSSELEQAPQGDGNPRDYLSDIVRQALDDFGFYVQAEMLSHSATSLGHTANTLAKGQ
jgi:hypothetical protein